MVFSHKGLWILIWIMFQLYNRVSSSWTAFFSISDFSAVDTRLLQYTYYTFLVLSPKAPLISVQLGSSNSGSSSSFLASLFVVEIVGKVHTVGSRGIATTLSCWQWSRVTLKCFGKVDGCDGLEKNEGFGWIFHDKSTVLRCCFQLGRNGVRKLLLR